MSGNETGRVKRRGRNSGQWEWCWRKRRRERQIKDDKWIKGRKEKSKEEKMRERMSRTGRGIELSKRGEEDSREKEKEEYVKRRESRRSGGKYIKGRRKR